MADKAKSIPVPNPDADNTYSLAEVAQRFRGEHKFASVIVPVGSDVSLARVLDTFGINPTRETASLVGGMKVIRSPKWFTLQDVEIADGTIKYSLETDPRKKTPAGRGVLLRCVWMSKPTIAADDWVPETVGPVPVKTDWKLRPISMCLLSRRGRKVEMIMARRFNTALLGRKYQVRRIGA
jgi:hypothetical protein